MHGQDVTDPYRWLETSESLKVMRWLAVQQAIFADHRARWSMLAEMRSRITAALTDDVWSPPKVRGERIFATQRIANAEHPRLVVIRAGVVRVLLDLPAVDIEGTTTLDRWDPSPLGQVIAVQTSRRGTERSGLAVIDATSGEVVDGPISGLRYSPIAWLDDATFYYVRKANVWLHRLGTPTADDRLVVAPSAGRSVMLDVRIYQGRWLIAEHSHGTGQRRDV
ncbi:MAG: hypothetical protein ABR608_02260, partial [Pseudonocardiaceae bacterium]